MVLIVGGEASGKRSFARTLGFRDGDMADGTLDGRPVVFHAERLAARGRAPEELADLLARKEVVICTEVGSGVIPADREQRLAREAAGRLSILLAQRAEAVVRMVCGVPTAIKGALPCR